MPLSDFLLHVFCRWTTWTATSCGTARSRGPRLDPADPEVITIELVGEFLGSTTTMASIAHFRRTTRPTSRPCPRLPDDLRPAGGEPVRVEAGVSTPPGRAAAAGDRVRLVDSLPVEACRFARANFCRRFSGEAAFGHDHTGADRLRVPAARPVHAEPGSSPSTWPRPTERPGDGRAARSAGRDAGVGDRNYWSPRTRGALAGRG